MKRTVVVLVIAAVLALGSFRIFYGASSEAKVRASGKAIDELSPLDRVSLPTEAEAQGGLELDVKSNYSHIRITKSENTRTLWFVRDNGEEVVESMLDLSRPHNLLVTYTKFMFTSYLFKPKQDKVVIVGLGGGSMVHFLKHYDPKVKVDVLEIDPVIVKVADKFFGVKGGGNVNIITTDGFKYFQNTDARYDVIYMDAFLKPSRETDETGVPLRLKTIQFYKGLQKKLTADGLVVYNLNPHSALEDDVRNIRDAFPQTYVFRLPHSEGLVVVGSMAKKRVPLATLQAQAGELDRRFGASFSFREMVRELER